MIAYKTQWLDALSVKAQAGKWFKKGLLTPAQSQEIQNKFTPGFYTPNMFVRVGLFIFTWILVCSIFGLLGVTLIEEVWNSETGAAIVALLFGIILFAGLEFFIRDKHYYCAGIDDALLYMALGLIIGGLCFLCEPVIGDHLFFYFLLAFPFLAAATIRYTDRLTAVAAHVCVVAMLFLGLESYTFTRTIIPFVCMVFSAISYFRIHTLKKRDDLRFWSECLEMTEACALILFYLSGNYFIVKELGELLFPGYDLPFDFLFYILTAIIPLIYVYFGLKNFDRLLVRLGLLMIALSVVTFKYYFSLGHHEITLTIAGAIMVGIAYACIRYLKENNTIFTYQEDITDETPGFANAEALLVAQTFGTPVTPEKGLEFGGGQFGGGGAGGNY